MQVKVYRPFPNFNFIQLAAHRAQMVKSFQDFFARHRRDRLEELEKLCDRFVIGLKKHRVKGGSSQQAQKALRCFLENF